MIFFFFCIRPQKAKWIMARLRGILLIHFSSPIDLYSFGFEQNRFGGLLFTSNSQQIDLDHLGSHFLRSRTFRTTSSSIFPRSRTFQIDNQLYPNGGIWWKMHNLIQIDSSCIQYEYRSFGMQLLAIYSICAMFLGVKISF